MHIGFLTSEYPEITARVGGIGTSVKSLASSLVESGHQITVFGYGKEDIQVEIAGVNVIFIKSISLPFIGGLLTRKKMQKLINGYVNKYKIQLIEAPDWSGMAAFLNLNCPLVIRIHGSDTYFCSIEGRKVKPKNKFLEKRGLKRANHIVSVSQYAADKTKQIFNLKNDIQVIYNGVGECETYAQASTSENNILYFGTLIRKKGVLFLPEIMKRVWQKFPNCKLVLIGNDSADILTGSSSTWDLIKAAFTDRELLLVEYKGAMDQKDLFNHIVKAKICVFPSYAEAFPMSWLEAMNLGKAIVGGDELWAHEMINDGISGFLRNPNDSEMFSDAICNLLNNKELRNEIEKRARGRIAEKFLSKNLLEENLLMYQKVVKAYV